MSVVFLCGVPCSGKTNLVKSVLKDLGSYKNIEPMKLFHCQKYKDVLVVGKYPNKESFGGTDKLSYGTIPKFKDFINQEYSKHKHILIEGDRFCRAEYFEWLLDNYDAKIIVLTVSPEEEKKRHIKRKDTQSEKWLKSRRTQINNIMTNFSLLGKLEVRSNNSIEDYDRTKYLLVSFLHL